MQWLGVAASAMALACGGNSTQTTESAPDLPRGGSASGGRWSSGAHGGGRGAVSTAGLGGEPGTDGGLGGTPDSAGGASDPVIAGPANGEAGETGVGGESSGGDSSGGDSSLPQAGAPPTPTDGGAPGDGGGGHAVGGSGSSGEPDPSSCLDVPNVCGADAPARMRIEVGTSTYCVKLGFYGDAQLWVGASSVDETCPVTQSNVSLRAGTNGTACQVVFGPAGPHADPRFYSTYVYSSSGRSPCVTRISRELFDSVPGNQFCACP